MSFLSSFLLPRSGVIVGFDPLTPLATGVVLQDNSGTTTRPHDTKNSPMLRFPDLERPAATAARRKPGSCDVFRAFLAARAGTPVTMPLVLHAARVELRKLERPINENELRYLEPAGASA